MHVNKTCSNQRNFGNSCLRCTLNVERKKLLGSDLLQNCIGMAEASRLIPNYHKTNSTFEADLSVI